MRRDNAQTKTQVTCSATAALADLTHLHASFSATCKRAEILQMQGKCLPTLIYMFIANVGGTKLPKGIR